MVNFLGFLASVISFTVNIPSVMAVWRNRHDEHALRGASVTMNVLIMCNALLWTIYAILTSAFWVGAPGLINFPLAATNAFLILRARRRASAGAQGMNP